MVPWQIAVESQEEEETTSYIEEDVWEEKPAEIGKINLFSYAVSRNRLEQAISDLILPHQYSGKPLRCGSGSHTPGTIQENAQAAP